MRVTQGLSLSNSPGVIETNGLTFSILIGGHLDPHLIPIVIQGGLYDPQRSRWVILHMPPSLTMSRCRVRSVSPEKRFSNSYSPSNHPLNPKRTRKRQTEKGTEKEMEKQTEKQAEKQTEVKTQTTARKTQMETMKRLPPACGTPESGRAISCRDAPKTLPHVHQTAALRRLLRFDDCETRRRRRATDKLTAVREVWRSCRPSTTRGPR